VPVHGKSFVIVEDDQIINESLTAYFGTHNRVRAFTSAEKMLEATPPVDNADIFIIDYKLPGKNGVELFQELRKSFLHSKYILITGEMNYEVAEQTRQLGPDALILKPFDYRILEANISGLVAKHN
jgi:DNA-binding NarL/FixJ family response regulator